MRKIEDYVDKFGVITQKDGDGGDSIHKTLMYHLGCKWWAYPSGILNYWESLNKFVCWPHQYSFRRHPDSSKWYGHCDRLSRDQATPLVISLGEFGFKKILWVFMLKHILRLGFMTNTRRNWQYPTLKEHNEHNHWVDWNYDWKLPDFAGPEFWGYYIRALKLWPLYPLLVLFDFENLVNTIIKCWFYGKDPKNSDDQNHILSLLQSQRRLPTPISWLSRKVYVRYRPMAQQPKIDSNGCIEYRTYSGPQSALQYYFAEEHGGPPIDLVFKEIVEDM